MRTEIYMCIYNQRPAVQQKAHQNAWLLHVLCMCLRKMCMGCALARSLVCLQRSYYCFTLVESVHFFRFLMGLCRTPNFFFFEHAVKNDTHHNQTAFIGLCMHACKFSCSLSRSFSLLFDPFLPLTLSLSFSLSRNRNVFGCHKKATTIKTYRIGRYFGVFF